MITICRSLVPVEEWIDLGRALMSIMIGSYEKCNGKNFNYVSLHLEKRNTDVSPLTNNLLLDSTDFIKNNRNENSH